jgi:hypothetical protein
MDKAKVVAFDSLVAVVPRSGIERRRGWKILIAASLALALIAGSVAGYQVRQRAYEISLRTSEQTISKLENQIAATPVVDVPSIIAETKAAIANEMGLLPLGMIRKYRDSFCVTYAFDNQGQAKYGLSGYLGEGYFITASHLVSLKRNDRIENPSRKLVAINLVIGDETVKARVVDKGKETSGKEWDWAILKVPDVVDLPKLTPVVGFSFEFAEPFMRFGNDYDQGIIVSSGIFGGGVSDGVITALTDGHPGVSGGGILNRQGQLVGITLQNVGGDYRLNVILPLREEMFRKVPREVWAEP